MLEDNATIMKLRKSSMVLSTRHSDAGRSARAPLVLLGCVFAAGLCLSGCSAKDQGGELAPTVTVQVGTAENEAIQRKVIADAVIYPLNQAAIVPKIAAPVKKFYVERGSQVHAGQLLAELESQDLAGASADTQGGLIQAQAAYDAAVQKARQDLELAKQVLDGAQKLYDSRQSLYKEGAVSGKDVDDARVSLTQARAEDETAQKQLDLKIAEATAGFGEKAASASAEAQLSYSQDHQPDRWRGHGPAGLCGRNACCRVPGDHGDEPVRSGCARARLAARGGWHEGRGRGDNFSPGRNHRNQGQGYVG